MRSSIFTPDQFLVEHYNSQNLANYLVKKLDRNKNVYDFGCGNGFYVAELEKAGFKVLGFEGTPGAASKGYSQNIVERDLCVPLDLNLEYGTCISLEVAEHIDKAYEEIFVDNIIKYCHDTLIISWAVLGQPGLHHVNCQNNEYVIDLMLSKGFELLKDDTAEVRALAGKDLSWFNNTLFVFKKKTND